MDQSPNATDGNGRSRCESCVGLETEIAFLKRELEEYRNPDILFGMDKYHSAKYWRDRCLKAENNLDALKVMYADFRNKKKEG